MFRRGPNAPTALYEVGAQLGWATATSVDLSAIQPPTYAGVDVHDLRRRGARWQAWAIEGPGGVLASHLEVFNDEYDQPVYDVAGRAAPDHTRVALPHVEIGWRLVPYGHHRLAGRFGSRGSRKVSSKGTGMAVRVSRDCDEAAVDSMLADPRWTDIGRRAQAISRTGLAVEIVGGRAVVFTTTATAPRGTERWRELIAAEEVLHTILDEHRR